jgi:molybdopterin/thiamine biosynthesis adenylyltransferase
MECSFPPTNSTPCLRDDIGAARDAEGHLRIIIFSERRHLVFQVTEPIFSLIPLLDGSHTIRELTALMQVDFPTLTSDDIQSTLNLLDDEGVLTYRFNTRPVGMLNEDERERFRRQLSYLRDFSESVDHPDVMQRRVRDSTVAVLGLGGTGTWIAQSLARIGVGRLRLVDFDNVEASNLARQVLYGVSDIGRPKALAARLEIERQFGGDVVVEAIDRVVEPPLDDLVDACDFVINCADEPDINKTAAWVAEACMTQLIPHQVGGGYDGHIGMIGPTIIPFASACWTCFQTDFQRRQPSLSLTYLTPTHKYSGALAPLAAAITNIQVWDVLRVISGCGKPLLANRTGELDFQTLSLSWTEVPRNVSCLMCGASSESEESNQVMEDQRKHG